MAKNNKATKKGRQVKGRGLNNKEWKKIHSFFLKTEESRKNWAI